MTHGADEDDAGAQGYASPPCSRHELDPGYTGEPPDDEPDPKHPPEHGDTSPPEDCAPRAAEPRSSRPPRR